MRSKILCKILRLILLCFMFPFLTFCRIQIVCAELESGVGRPVSSRYVSATLFKFSNLSLWCSLTAKLQLHCTASGFNSVSPLYVFLRVSISYLQFLEQDAAQFLEPCRFLLLTVRPPSFQPISPRIDWAL